MPARKAIVLTLDDVELTIAAQAGTGEVTLSLRTDGPYSFERAIPVNDFKDFVAMLGDLKPALITPVHAPKPVPQMERLDRYIKEHEVTC